MRLPRNSHMRANRRAPAAPGKRPESTRASAPVVVLVLQTDRLVSRATTSWPASDRRGARSPSGCRSKSETQSHNADLGGNERPHALSEGRGSTEAESPGKQFRPKQVHRSASLQFHLRPTLWSGPSNSGTRLPETFSPVCASRCHSVGNAADTPVCQVRLFLPFSLYRPRYLPCTYACVQARLVKRLGSPSLASLVSMQQIPRFHRQFSGNLHHHHTAIDRIHIHHADRPGYGSHPVDQFFVGIYHQDRR